MDVDMGAGMQAMGAIGAYLRTLREAQHLSRAALAAALDTHESQLVRIEAGEQDPRGTFLLRLLSRLRGKADDIIQLLDQGGDEAMGRQLAHRRLAGDPSRINPQQRAVLERLTDDQLRRLIALAETIAPPQ